MKKSIIKCCVYGMISLLFPINSIAQTTSDNVVNQSNSIRKLSIRPYLALGISPVDAGELMVQTNLDAQFWLNSKMDLRAGFHSGTFTGGAIGGTWYLKNRIVTSTQKFIISETETSKTRTTKYFRARAEQRRIFGLAADIKVGLIGSSKDNRKFYNQIDFGVDYQFFARNYADRNGESYPSNRNGWYSFKLQGIAITGPKFGLGVAGTLQASRRPWKGVTMYLNVPLGIIKTFGTNGELVPIITPGFGLSINLIKNK